DADRPVGAPDAGGGAGATRPIPAARTSVLYRARQPRCGLAPSQPATLRAAQLAMDVRASRAIPGLLPAARRQARAACRDRRAKAAGVAPLAGPGLSVLPAQ